MKSGIFCSLNDAIAFSKSAFIQYSKLNLSQRQEIIEAIKHGIHPLLPDIAQMIVEETCMGNVYDKVAKMELVLSKTPGVGDLVTEVKTGDHGMTLYELSAYGLICALQPSTSPIATLLNNTISMLAGGNAIIHIPHPRAINVTQFVIEKISKIIRDTSGLENLVVTIGETSMSIAGEIMAHPDVDMVVATGGSDVLRRAMACSKKVIGAGPANPVVIVDETADIKKAGADIVKGASFDNNILCISEKCIVAVDVVVEELVNEMKKNGAFFIDTLEDALKLTFTAITDEGIPNKAFEGKNACRILDAAGIKHPGEVKLIILECSKEHPFVTSEVKMPIVPIVQVVKFEQAIDVALEVEQGYGHTAIIHSQTIQRLNYAAKIMQTAIFVKNASSLAGIGFGGEGSTSFTISTTTGEGSTTARHFTRRRRCTLSDGFTIR